MWLGVLGRAPIDEERHAARRIEALGYGSIWTAEGIGGKEAFAHQAGLLAATQRIDTGTWIANVWARHPATMLGGAATLGAAYPGRFVLGVGISHAPAVERSGHEALPVGINSHGYIAESSQEARDDVFPSYAAMMNKIGKERGWRGMSRRDFDAACSPRGALLVGSPDEVIEKILFQHEIFGHERFLMQASMGAIPHHKILHAIELFGTKVAPVVRRETESTAIKSSADARA